jgi:hypothetical protein
MSRFKNSGIGLVSSITQAPAPPCNIVSAATKQAGFGLTGKDNSEANTEIDVTPTSGMELVLVNNGGTKYTSAITNSTAYTAATNEQTNQKFTKATGGTALNITTTVAGGSIVKCVVGTQTGGTYHSGDTFTVNNGTTGAVLARVAFP